MYSFSTIKGHFAGNTGDEAGGSALGDETIYDGPYLGAKYIEIFLVVDSVLYDEFGEETEAYATTLMNIVSNQSGEKKFIFLSWYLYTC